MLEMLQARGDGALIVPVPLYIFAIILMVWSACMNGNRWLLIMSTYYGAHFFIFAQLGKFPQTDYRE